MKARLGFEFEVGHKKDSYTFLNDIRRRLPKNQAALVKYVGDRSVHVPRMHEGEIVTSPMPETTALKFGNTMFDILTELGCITNTSTGFHVNVSMDGSLVNQRMYANPFALLAYLRESEYLYRWGRQNSGYARAWESTFFANLYDANDSWVTLNSYDQWKHNCNMFMEAVTYNPSAADNNEFVKEQVDAYKEKLISVSIPYLWERGYIEYRIIGGNYLPRKVEAMTDVTHFIEATRYMTNYDPRCVEQYLEKTYQTYKVKNES
jgi:hypothetical protein